MTTYQHDARLLSTADGTTVANTAASPGAPDTFTASVGGGTGTVTHRTSGGAFTGRHWHFNATTAVNARGDRNVTSTPRMAWMAMVDLGAGGVENIIMNFTTASGLRLVHAATGEIALYNQGGSFVWQTSAAVSGRVKLFLGAEIGSGTGDGELHVDVYAGSDVDTSTPTYSYDSSTGNAGTSNFTQFRFGKVGSGGITGTRVQWISGSDTQFTDTGLDLITNSAPTASAGADQTNVEPYSTVTLTGTDSDSDGTIASRAWTQTAGSPTVTLSGSGATRTFTAPGTLAGTTLTFQYSVTDDGGATTTDTMTVAVLPAAERLMIGGSWVPARLYLLP